MKQFWEGHNRTRIWSVRLGVFVLLVLFIAGPAMSVQEDDEEIDVDYGAAKARKLVESPEHWITADHSEFEALDKEFTSGPEVTAACLSCHNEAAKQIHETIHWTWMCPADPNKEMGKAGLTYNNF